MGSFNNVCSISNMIINPGDEVILFFIQENARDGGFACYPQDRWGMMNFPLEARYADYNRYTIDDTQPNYIKFLNYLKENLIPLPENDRDSAVSADNLSVESIFDFMHEGRLFVKDSFGARYYGKEKAIVQKYAILREVWDKITTSEYPHFWQDKKMSVQHLYRELKAVVDEVQSELQNKISNFERLSAEDEKHIQLLTELRFHSRASTKLRADLMIAGSHKNMDYFEEGDSYLKNIATMNFLQFYLQSIFKLVRPMMTGSQDFYSTHVEEFHKMCHEVSLERKQKFMEDGYEF